jgi:hypothetical protein
LSPKKLGLSDRTCLAWALAGTFTYIDRRFGQRLQADPKNFLGFILWRNKIFDSFENQLISQPYLKSDFNFWRFNFPLTVP